jgi:hypothetical protein
MRGRASLGFHHPLHFGEQRISGPTDGCGPRCRTYRGQALTSAHEPRGSLEKISGLSLSRRSSFIPLNSFPRLYARPDGF